MIFLRCASGWQKFPLFVGKQGAQAIAGFPVLLVFLDDDPIAAVIPGRESAMVKTGFIGNLNPP